MSTIGLLTELANAGVSLRRLSGDRIEVQGKLNPAFHQRIRDAKPELLAILPDPGNECRQLYADAIEHANAVTPADWFGTPDEWRELQAITDRFQQSIDNGDADAGRDCYANYVSTINRIINEHEAIRWASRLRWPAACKAGKDG